MTKDVETTSRAAAEGEVDTDAKRDAALEAIEIKVLEALKAGPRALFDILKVACRYCWGQDHAFQWKTEREFTEALADALDHGRRPPSSVGGIGYRRDRAPNPDCPECSGQGLDQVRISDSEQLPDGAAHLISRISTGPHGLNLTLRSPRDLLSALHTLQAISEANGDGAQDMENVILLPRTEHSETFEESLDRDVEP